MASNGNTMMQTGIFEDLQRKIDDDTAVKDVRHQAISRKYEQTNTLVQALRDIVQSLEKQGIILCLQVAL